MAFIRFITFVAISFTLMLFISSCSSGGGGDSTPAVTTTYTYYKDADGDGYSDGTSENVTTASVGYYLATELAAITGDCDDADPATYTGALEVCNGIDNDCQGDGDRACYVLQPTAPDEYEGASSDDEFDIASYIAVGESQLRTIFPQGDSDWVNVDLEAGTTYEFITSYISALSGTRLVLAKPNLDYVTESNGYISNSGRILYTPTVSGTYYLVVYASGHPYAVASYTLYAKIFIDSDGDTFSTYFDCDDSNASIYPRASETLGDGIDQSCTGSDTPSVTAADSFEDDDTFDLANPLPMARGDIDELIHRDEIYSQSHTLDNPADVDWMSVTVPARGKIYIGYLGYTGGANLELFEDNGAVSWGWFTKYENFDTWSTTLLLRANYVGAEDAYVLGYSYAGTDLDFDGYYTLDRGDTRDCDDTNETVFPRAPESLDDGVDSNCDGVDGLR